MRALGSETGKPVLEVADEEEIRVLEGSALIGSTIAEILREHLFAYVVGLRRADRLHPWHAIDGPIQPGDVLVALGAPDYLIALASAATGAIDTQSVAVE